MREARLHVDFAEVTDELLARGDPVGGQGLGKVVVSGVWLGVMGAWSLWILG